MFKKTYGGRYQSEFLNETNDCTVMTVKQAFGLTYTQAHNILKWAGRKDKQGFGLSDWLDRLKLFNVRIQGREVSYYRNVYGKGYRVKQFLKTHKKGVWILHVREHVFCVKEGVVYDGINSFDKNFSIMYYYRIKQPNEV